MTDTASYVPLHTYLKARSIGNVSLTFDEIEALLGFSLPQSGPASQGMVDARRRRGQRAPGRRLDGCGMQGMAESLCVFRVVLRAQSPRADSVPEWFSVHAGRVSRGRVETGRCGRIDSPWRSGSPGRPGARLRRRVRAIAGRPPFRPDACGLGKRKSVQVLDLVEGQHQVVGGPALEIHVEPGVGRVNGGSGHVRSIRGSHGRDACTQSHSA